MLHAGTYYYCIIGKGQGFDLGVLDGNSHGDWRGRALGAGIRFSTDRISKRFPSFVQHADCPMRIHSFVRTSTIIPITLDCVLGIKHRVLNKLSPHDPSLYYGA
jgi:hypothetical protein